MRKYPPATGSTADTELLSLGGSDPRPFRLRVDRCGCGVLTLIVVALLTAFPVWTRRYALFGCHEPSSHTAVGGHSDALANCTVDAMLERLYAADCRASITDSGGDETGYWSCGAPACADTVEQLSTECLPELNQFHHALSRPRVPVSAQKVLAALPSDLNVTAFREDCKGVLDDRAQQQRARDADGPARQEKGIRVGQAAVGLSLLVAVIVGVAVKIRKRSRRTEREDSPVRSPSENSTGSSSADSGTDSDGAAVPPPVAPEQLVEHELLAQRELPFLELTPHDLEALPPAFSDTIGGAIATDAEESSSGVSAGIFEESAADRKADLERQERRKAKLAERAKARSQKLVSMLQTDPLGLPLTGQAGPRSLELGVDDSIPALWLGDEATSGGASSEEAATADRLAKMMADDGAVDEWLQPDLLPRMKAKPKAADTSKRGAAGAGAGDTAQQEASPPESAQADKRHHCPFPGCTYASVGTGHLFRHFKVHTREKPFECDWPGCSYSTAQPGHLTAHKRGHTGEKPFKCTVDGCDYASARSWHVTRHMRSVHKSEGGGAAHSAPAE